MRVMHVGHGRMYGGIETLLYALALYRELCPAMDPHFALSFEGRLSDELVRSGVLVHHLGDTRISRPLTILRARRALRSALESRQFDIVVCHSAWTQAVLGPAVKHAGVPLAFWQHGPTTGRHWLERWAKTCRPRVAVSNSTFTACTLAQFYPGVEVQVVYCPVPLPEAQAADVRAVVRREFSTADEATVIVQVGRLESGKGHFAHLDALALLRHLPDWVCWFIGGAQNREEVQYLKDLQATARTLGISDRVRFCGQRSDVPRILSAADVYCQPNVRPEGFGITFVEALNAGLPVISTAIGGASEIVDSSCGVLVAPGNTPELAEALARLVVDPGERARLGSAGPRRAHDLCNPAARLGELEQVFARAIS